MDTETVQLYGADWCADCTRAKAWLTARGVRFTEIDVEHDAVARARAVELAGGKRNIPVLVLGDGTVLVEPSDADLAAAVR